MALMMSVFSALSYGTADFLGGVGTRRNPAYAVLFWSQLVGLLVAAVAAPLLGVKRVTATDIAWGVAAGIAGAAGVMVLYQALASTVAAVVSPTAAIVGAVLPVIVGISLGERPAPLAWIGVALALPAIVLLTTEKGTQGTRVLRALRSGILSGIGFGVFFVCISRTSPESGLVPLIGARVASTTLVLVITAVMGRSLRTAKRGRYAVGLSGALDMAANVFFLVAARMGMLAIATVVTSLYPAPTVVLSRIVYRERVGPLRLAGIGLAIAGVSLIGIG